MPRSEKVLCAVSLNQFSICFCWAVRLCEDFIAAVKTSEVGPVPGLLVSFLQQAVASVGTIVGPLSACLPEDLVRHVLVGKSLFLYALGLTAGMCLLVLHPLSSVVGSVLLQTSRAT